jgi:phage baseplate assembly protein V
MHRRIMLAVGRAVLNAVDDVTQLQRVQVTGLDGEVIDAVERFQTYGLSTHPHPGAEAILLAVGGNRNHPIVITVDDRRYRLRGLDQGEVAIYDDQDQVVHLTRDGIVVSTPKGVTVQAAGDIELASDTRVAIAAPTVEINAETGFVVQAGQIGMQAEGAARLAGDEARLHGQSLVAWDANGLGFAFGGGSRRLYYAGTGAQELPPDPPEVEA